MARTKKRHHRTATHRRRHVARRRGTMHSIHYAGSKKPVSAAVWHHSPFRRNPRRRHRRHRRHFLRHNPPRGLFGQVLTGAVDALYVLGGEAGTNLIHNLYWQAVTKPNVESTSMLASAPMQLVVRVAGAVAIGYGAGFISREAARFVLAGGLATVLRAPLKQVPVVGRYLGDEGQYGAYVQLPPPVPVSHQLAAYPSAMSLAGTDDETAMQYNYGY